MFAYYKRLTIFCLEPFCRCFFPTRDRVVAKASPGTFLSPERSPYHKNSVDSGMKVGWDKWKHFFTGIPLGIAIQLLLALNTGLHPLTILAISIVLLVVICYGFELFSLATGMGHYEWADAWAGIAGGLIGISLVVSVG